MSEGKMATVLEFLKKDVRSMLTTPIPLPGLPTAKPAVRTKPARRKAESSAEQNTRSRQLIGELTSGAQTRFAIEGYDFEITGDTWVVGQVRVGAKAKVRIARGPNGAPIATSITVLEG